jgi:predicted nucleic acid-binding protein
LPDIISNTSPLQYLHQLGLLDALHKLVGALVIPQAVVDELAVGRALGYDLPDLTQLDWIIIRPLGEANAQLSLPRLGRGETEVIQLALASNAEDVIVILDDALARRATEEFGLKLTGTLGIILDAKRAGLISAVAPFLDRLEALGFRLADQTRSAVLKVAGETGADG